MATKPVPEGYQTVTLYLPEDLGDWRVKVYGIGTHAPGARPEFVAATLRAARETLPAQPASLPSELNLFRDRGSLDVRKRNVRRRPAISSFFKGAGHWVAPSLVPETGKGSR